MTATNGAGPGFAMLPGEKAGLVDAIGTMRLPSVDHIEKQLTTFHERFPLSRLARLEGVELLHELHGRESGDCLMYWLEFKKDDSFDTSWFGSIGGGSALKFVIYQAADGGAWKSGSSRDIRVLTEKEAAGVAAAQRDQLLNAVQVVRALPADPTSPAYVSLQQDIEAAAPDLHQLGFFHKALRLYAQDKLDDYHSQRYQRHMLIRMGFVPPDGDRQLYHAARFFVGALRDLRQACGEAVPMGWLHAALNRRHGQPVGHWRVGTGQHGEFWPQMRDRGVVAVGWSDLGDLSDVVGGYSGHEGIDALKTALGKQWPAKTPQLVGKEARQLWAFYGSMKEGDLVYAASGQHILGVGEITGAYRYEVDEFGYAFRRGVKWRSTEPFKTRSWTGLRTTVYRLDRAFDILLEAVRHLDGAAPAPALGPKPVRIAKALAPIADQLQRKGQVILYGPPGTGKTYLALQAAEELVARATHHRAWADLSAAERDALKGLGAPEAQRLWICTFHPAYGYEDFVEGLKARPVEGTLAFEPEAGLFRRISELAMARRSEVFVLIVDEFNRGDAPRIFGELLTLLELDKRERVRVELPLSGDRFTVPRNLRLLATMNTADRSISLLDAALRRRFGFVEYLPDSSLLGDATVQGARLSGLLEVINERLLDTLGDGARNQQVGHAYLMSEAQPISSVVALRNAIRYDIFPLLQEYCAEDPNALHTLLGDSFYDRQQQRFVDELMETGRESDFVDALIKWEPDRLASDADPTDQDDSGLDEREDDEGAAA